MVYSGWRQSAVPKRTGSGTNTIDYNKEELNILTPSTEM